jgi:MraZ protein
MFRGLNLINIDPKGRIILPGRWRDSLANGAVLTVDTEERCLLLYPLASWEEIEQKLASLPVFNQAVRRIQRLLLGHATDLEVDNQGRILLPAALRDYAQLTKRMVLLGQGKKLEIWSEDHWQKSRDLWLTQANALPEVLAELAL